MERDVHNCNILQHPYLFLEKVCFPGIMLSSFHFPEYKFYSIQ